MSTVRELLDKVSCLEMKVALLEMAESAIEGTLEREKLTVARLRAAYDLVNDDKDRAYTLARERRQEILRAKCAIHELIDTEETSLLEMIADMSWQKHRSSTTQSPL